jgi:hypothetical protein
VCARKHPSDDDRQHPRGLADALSRWDTEQDWMRPTPGREADSSEHVPPPESTPARLPQPPDNAQIRKADPRADPRADQRPDQRAFARPDPRADPRADPARFAGRCPAHRRPIRGRSQADRADSRADSRAIAGRVQAGVQADPRVDQRRPEPPPAVEAGTRSCRVSRSRRGRPIRGLRPPSPSRSCGPSDRHRLPAVRPSESGLPERWPSQADTSGRTPTTRARRHPPRAQRASRQAPDSRARPTRRRGRRPVRIQGSAAGRESLGARAG